MSQAAEPAVDVPTPADGPLNAEELRLQLLQESVTLERAEPSVAQYVSHLGQRLGVSLFDRLEGGVRRWAPWLVDLFDGLVLVLLVVSVAVLLVWLIRFVLGRQRASDSSQGGVAVAEEAVEIDHLAVWQRRLEEHLAADRGDEALHALWWWWACFLKVEGADPSWTTRELIRRAQRSDLRPLARQFDYLAYGQGEPAGRQVASLWRRLQGDAA